MNDLNQITDLHNRRSNLNVVAERARRHGYPLLVWPEDKLLLRVSDLAAESFAGAHNTPTAWQSCKFVNLFFVPTDAELRRRIREGFGYTRVANLGQFSGTAIAEYEVKSL